MFVLLVVSCSLACTLWWFVGLLLILLFGVSCSVIEVLIGYGWLLRWCLCSVMCLLTVCWWVWLVVGLVTLVCVGGFSCSVLSDWLRFGVCLLFAVWICL